MERIRRTRLASLITLCLLPAASFSALTPEPHQAVTTPARQLLEQRLFTAAQSGRLETAKHLLQQGAAAFDTDNNPGNHSALSIALANGHPDMARLLLQADEDWPDQRSLFYAARLGDVEILKTVLERFDVATIGYPEASYPSTRCPVYESIRHGRQAAMELLLAYPDSNCADTLRVAVSSDQTALARWLLEHDADAKAALNHDPQQWLALAFRSASVDMVKLLQDHGIALENDPALPIAAAQRGNTDLLRHLQTQGFAVNTPLQDNYEPSPLYVALREGQDDTVDFLMQALTPNELSALQITTCPKPDPDAEQLFFTHEPVLLYAAGYAPLATLKRLQRYDLPSEDPCTQDTALHVAARHNKAANLAWLAEQNAYKAGLLKTNHSGETPLHIAARSGFTESIAALLDFYPNQETLNALRDQTGQTALLSAINADGQATENLIERLHRLHQAGIGLNNQDNTGDNALMRSIEQYAKTDNTDWLDTINWLLDHKALVHLTRHNGKNALQVLLAEERFSDDLFTALTKAGLNLEHRDKAGNTALHAAAALDNTEVAMAALTALLKAGVAPNPTNQQGQTPLHIAADKYQVDNVNLLLNAKADPTAKDKKGNTPLHIAAQSGNAEAVESLLQAGADLNAVNAAGDPPIHIASKPEITQLLLNKGASLTIRNQKGFGILEMYASLPNQNQALEQIQLALAAGAQAQPAQAGENTLLHLAIRSRSIPLTRYLLQYGFDPALMNEDGNTPLHLAVRGRSYSLVNELSQASAILDIPNRYGMSALQLAINLHEKDLVPLLLERGANLNTKDRDARSPLHTALDTEQYELAQQLLEQGADPLVASRGGWTALHFAARAGQTELIQTLLAKGANAHQRTWKGQTAAEIAREHQQVPSAERLEAALQQRPPAPNHAFGQTDLHLAIQQADLGSLQRLLATSADVNAKNSYGETPLQLALWLYHDQPDQARAIVQALLTAQADPNASNLQQETSLPFAVRERLPLALISELLQAGANPAATDLYGMPTILVAAQTGQTDIVAALLDRQPDLIQTQDRDGNHLLHYAVLSDQADLIQLLAQRGVAINQPNHTGQTALIIAFWQNKLTAGKALLALDADTQTANQTEPLLLQAMQLQQFDFARLLLDAGYTVGTQPLPPANEATTEAQDSEFVQVLSLAHQQGNALLDIVTSVLKQANDPALIPQIEPLMQDLAAHDANEVLAFYQHSAPQLIQPAKLLPTAVSANALTTVQWLQQQGADVKQTDQQGSLLHYAINGQAFETLQWLLEQDVPVNAQDADGNSAFDQLTVLIKEHDESIELLQQYASALLKAEPNPLYKDNFLANVIQQQAWDSATWLLKQVHFTFKTPPDIPADQSIWDTVFDAWSNSDMHFLDTAERQAALQTTLQQLVQVAPDLSFTDGEQPYPYLFTKAVQSSSHSSDKFIFLLEHKVPLPQGADLINLLQTDTAVLTGPRTLTLLQLLDQQDFDFAQPLDGFGNTWLHYLAASFYSDNNVERLKTTFDFVRQRTQQHQPVNYGNKTPFTNLLQNESIVNQAPDFIIEQLHTDRAELEALESPLFIASSSPYVALRDPKLVAALNEIPKYASELQHNGYTLAIKAIPAEDPFAVEDPFNPSPEPLKPFDPQQAFQPLQAIDLKPLEPTAYFQPAALEWLQTPFCETPDRMNVCITGLNKLQQAGIDLGAANSSDGDNPLHYAVKRNRRDWLDYFLKAGISPAIPNHRGNTPLHALAGVDLNSETGQALYELLINFKAPLNAQNKAGDTTLHLALREANTPLVKDLLERNADVNLVNELGHTALFDAVLKQAETANVQTANLDLILKHQPNVNQQDKEGNTVLHLIAQNGCHTDCETLLKRLMAQGLDITLNNADGETAAFTTAYRGDLTLLQLLLKQTSLSSQDFVQQTNLLANQPLHIALAKKATAYSTWLMTQQADLKAANTEPVCPTDLINEWQHTGLAQLAEQQGGGCGIHWTPAMRQQHHDPAYFASLFNTDTEALAAALMPAQTQWGYHEPTNNQTLVHRAIPKTSDAFSLSLLEKVDLPNQADNLGQTPLYLAISKPSLSLVQALLAQGADVNHRDELQNTALHIAVASGAVDVVNAIWQKAPEQLLQNNAMQQTPIHRAALLGETDVLKALLQLENFNPAILNQPDWNGNTPLHLALGSNKPLATAQVLVAAGADANRANENTLTPLFLALQTQPDAQQYALVELLLNHGAALNARDKDQRTPLLYSVWYYVTEMTPSQAAIQTRIRIVDLLLARGAQLDERDTLGRTVLHIATPIYPLAQHLLAKGADPTLRNALNESVLFQAVRATYPIPDKGEAFIQSLIARGTPVNEVNTNGETPLSAAVRHSNLPAIGFLLQAGADPNRTDNEYPLLFYIMQYGDPTERDLRHQILTQLVAHPQFKINATDQQGNNALQFALQNADSNMAIWLLKQGIDAKNVNKRGQTALHHFASASRYWDSEKTLPLWQALLKAEVPINQRDNNGYSALMLATMQGDDTRVQWLLETGANPSYRANDDKSALHMAVEKRDLAILQLLTAAGADRQLRNNRGETPLMMAQAAEWEEGIAVLAE